MGHGEDRHALPGGYFDARGQLHEHVVLAPLAGKDEELLASRGTLPARAVTALLARSVKQLGSLAGSDITADVMRQLLVADRQYLLLRLRALTFGSMVRGSCQCERPGCGERASVQFSIEDLPVRALAARRPHHECPLAAEVELGTGERVGAVTLRLPNGGDQEALCDAAAEGVGGAELLRQLVGRCLVGPRSVCAEQLAPVNLLAIERFLIDTAPLVDLEVCVHCPRCALPISIELDVQDFFFGELAASAARLYQDVHCLALHYHWSERDILELSSSKRERYIQMVSETLEADHA